MTKLDYTGTQLDPAGRAASAARFAYVVPLAFVTYSLAYLDRVNYGYAEAAGMSKSLHLSPNIAALLPSLFFIGYCLLQIPAANWAAKRNVKGLVFWALILWGLLSGLTGLIRSVPGLIAVRLLLGGVEGVVLPAMLIYLTRWFTKPERSRANALLILANPVMMMLASLVSGFLIARFNVHRIMGLEGWQVMFVIEGLPSLIWAGFWLLLADERPADAKWLSPEQSAQVQERLDAEQRAIAHIPNYWAAFADRRVILLAIMYLCLNACGYGLMFWMPTIIKGATSQGIAATGLISAVPYLLAIVSMLVVSYFADRTLRRKPFVWGSMFAGAAGYLLAFAAGPQHFWIGFVGLIIVGSCIYTPCGPLWAWMGDLLPRHVVGESMALVNSAGSLGGFVGTYTFGRLIARFGTGSGFIFLACMFIAAGVLGLAVRSRTESAPGGGFPVIEPERNEPQAAATSAT